MKDTAVDTIEGVRSAADDRGHADDFLISDYELFQKGYELWANHFMGVFYLWTGVVVVPTTAGGLLSDLGISDGNRGWLFGSICMAVALIGWYISLKMYDIRKAQLICVQQLNIIRKIAYDKMGITKRYGLRPFGSDADLKEASKKDFGRSMAVVMSGVHGFLLALGLTCVLLGWRGTPLVAAPGLLLGFLLYRRNYQAYFQIVTDKLEARANGA